LYRVRSFASGRRDGHQWGYSAAGPEFDVLMNPIPCSLTLFTSDRGITPAVSPDPAHQKARTAIRETQA
jgi:hypothetical protein